MIPNIDPDTGIAHGYISADALRHDVVMALLYNPLATDETFEVALYELLATERRDAMERGVPFAGDDHFRDQLSAEWNCEQPVIDGEVPVEGFGEVHYRSTWIGGTLSFCIMKSPFVTAKARGAHLMALEGAGILDTLDGNVTAYDVPANWRAAA